MDYPPKRKVKRFKAPADSWFESKKFKALNKKWHKTLEKSGFKDIEEFDSPLELLKTWDDIVFVKRYNNGTFLDKQRYYELAGQLLHTYKFDTELERNIWDKHCQGIGEQLIAKTLKCTEWKVKKTIRKVRLAIKRDAKDILEDLDKIRKSDD